VQNSVHLNEIGAASGTVTFFRSLGGTIGVSVLGAVLANRVSDNIAHGLSRIGVDPSAGGGDTGNLDVGALPGPIREIVRAAYGDATGHIFLFSALIAVVGIVAAAFLKPVTLRDSLDLPDAAASLPDDAASLPDGAAALPDGAAPASNGAAPASNGADSVPDGAALATAGEAGGSASR
jgi:hypothetical protein